MTASAQIPHEWLQREGSVEEFERAESERMASAFHLPIVRVVEKFGSRPFGSLTDAWRAFVSKKKEDEQLWLFRSPESSFAQKLGCQGFAIVSAGNIREVFVTLMS